MKRIYELFTIYGLICFFVFNLVIPGRLLFSVQTGETYYVAKNGSDANPGSEAQPWLTLKKAAATLAAGDTVYVKAGTYEEQLAPSRSGSSGAWITYKAYPGDTVIVDGSGLNIGSTGLVYINGKAYIEVNGFQVLHSSYVGALIWGASNYINLKNLTISDTQRSGINISYDSSASHEITNVIVDGCDVSYTNLSGYWEAFSFNRVNTFEISNNLVHDVQGQFSPIEAQKEGIDCKIGCTNGSIHHNEIYNAKQGIYLDATVSSISNIDIFSNYIHNCSISGILLGSEGHQQPMDNIVIFNNIVFDNYIGFSSAADSFDKNFILVNNTLCRNEKSEISIADGARYQHECIVRNNTLYSQNGDAYLLQYDEYPAGIEIDHNLFYAPSYAESNVYGIEFIQGEDPLFLDAQKNDFRIDAASPAIDVGSDSGAPSDDCIGTSRPRGNGYDIGAYEFPE